MPKFLRNLIYAFPAFSFAIPTFPVMILLPALYTEKFGMEISMIGLILFLAKMIDIFTDPIMGWLNDRNFFSRKVWLFLGGTLALFALKKLFLIDSLPYESYLLIWISVLYVGWTIFQIPYLSIGYDLERDYFLRDGFLIKESNKWYNVNSNENFEVIGITKSLPPTKIMIKYNKCEVYYNIIRDLKGITTCYFYNGYYYIPENRRLLRYSPSGIVTSDYIICRVTITGEESKNNLLLKIEK